MSEREDALILTSRNTFVKGWVEFHGDSDAELKLDLDTHPYLKRTKITIRPVILINYKYNGELNFAPGGF